MSWFTRTLCACMLITAIVGTVSLFVSIQLDAGTIVLAMNSGEVALSLPWEIGELKLWPWRFYFNVGRRAYHAEWALYERINGMWLTAPIYHICAFFAAGWIAMKLPLFVNKQIRRSRLRRGLCVQCGYNLSGSPSQKCSECGVEAASGRDKAGGTDER
jgi:hypothetical protein